MQTNRETWRQHRRELQSPQRLRTAAEASLQQPFDFQFFPACTTVSSPLQ